MVVGGGEQVSSTETGHIFGTIVYENSSTAEKTYINLNDIHMDIMDYIKPASCSEEAFRSMWAEFEWENKASLVGRGVSALNVLFCLVWFGLVCLFVCMFFFFFFRCLVSLA